MHVGQKFMSKYVISWGFGLSCYNTMLGSLLLIISYKKKIEHFPSQDVSYRKTDTENNKYVSSYWSEINLYVFALHLSSV